MTIRVLAIITTVLIVPQTLMAAPRCAEADTECLLRTIEFQARENEAQKLRLEYLSKAQNEAQQWAQQERLDKQKCLEKASEPPSRMKWFLLGTATALALGLGAVIATH